MSEQGDGAIKNLGLFSTLQAATEVNFFLLSTTFALLIDNTLLALKQPGLMELALNKETLSASNITFQIILIFLAFSFLTSLVLPIAAAIIDEIYIHTAGSWISKLGLIIDRKLGIERRTPSREHNCVSPGELKEEAHRTQEKYYLDLYKDYETKWISQRDNMIRFAFYSFCCLAMLLSNFYMGHLGMETVTNVITNYVDSTQPIWTAIAALLLMVFWRFYSNNDTYWIYCPNLYDKITKNRKYSNQR